MESIFDRPVIPDEVQQTWWRGLRYRKAAKSIDHFMAELASGEETHSAFEPKDLLDAFPVLVKPGDFGQGYRESDGARGAHVLCPKSQLVASDDDQDLVKTCMTQASQAIGLEAENGALKARLAELLASNCR